MKTARPLASRLGLALAAAAAVMSLSTCDDFFGTEDLKEQIQEDVALANAESVSFTINAAPSSGGTLSMSGVQTKKVGENFSISATVFDNYVFGGWTSSGGGEVTFAYPNEADETTTIAKIGAASDDVVITANFVARPYVKTVTPSEGNTVVKNQPIIANFSKAMDPDSFSLPGRVTVTYDGINPTTANPRTIYASGSSSSYFTVGITSTRLTLTPTGSFMPANSTITVLISSDVTDADGTTMAESKEWYFYTNNDTDTSAPEIDGITIRNGNSSAAVARTFTSGDTYHAVKSRSVTVEIAAHTISASSTVQSMVLIESGYSGGVSTSRTTELGYTDSYAYTLATTDDGPKALTYYVKSSTGIESAHESINLYLDSAPPTLSFGTITSNNTTNPAYARESSVVSLAFTAADASGSGIYSTTATVAGQDASVSGSTATLTVAAGATDGPVSYSMTVTDYAGNSVTGSAGATGSVTVDRTPPTVNVASAGNKTVGRNGETISFTATFADANGIDETTAPAIVIGGISHTMAKSTNLVWTYDYPVPTGDSAPTFAVAIDATDVAGNDNTAATGVQSVIVDNTKPTISAGAITITGVTANAGYAREGSIVRIPLTISESSTGVSTKPTVKLTDAGGTEIATMAVTNPVGTAPTYTCEATYTMTASNAEVLLHYTISGTTDGAGNVMTAIGPATTGRTYDRTLPTASYIYLGSDTSPGATYTTTGKPAAYSDAADGNGVYTQFSYDDGGSWTPASPAAFTSGSTAVDLTSGNQGSRTVQMKVFDAAGNQKASELSDTVVFDSVAPVASVTGVTVSAGNAGYAILNSVITLTISVAEGTSGMATAPSASIRNASDALIADMAVSGPTGTGPYVYTATYTMDGDDPEVALYYKVSGAEDGAGNVMTAGNLVNLNRTYDRTVPAPEISAPADGAYVNADATMTITADGGSLTAKIGSNGTTSYTSGTTKISALAGWSAVAEGGDVAVTVYSTDAAGNVGDATRTFKKDTVKPVASVTGVTVSAGNTGYAILNSVITLTISVAEGTSGMATAPSASIRNASDALIADMAVSGPTGTGPYVYTATYTMDGDDPEVALYYKVSGAEDGAGNVMTAGNLVNLNRTYDRTVPAPSITAPAAAAYVNADATMTITADGGSLTAKIGSNGTSSYTSGSTKISALAGWADVAENGDVAVTVYSTDTAGNVGSATRTFKKDTTPPAPEISAPADGAYVNADATMTVSADGGTLTAKIGTNTASSYTSGSTKLSALAGWSAVAEDGDVAVTVYSTDAAGNVGDATRTFKKDTVKPVASVTGVTVSAGNTGYAILNSVITLTISVAEGTSGMATAPSASIRNASDALIADMAVSGPTGTGPYVYTATYTMDGDDPEVALYYKVSGAEDGAGNVMMAGSLVNLNRTYDRTVPAPEISAPADGAYVNADATMTVSADGGTLTAKIGTNTASSYTSGSTKLSALAGWSAVAEGGDVAVTVYSTDAAGNVGDATRTFKKDTTPPAPEISAPADGAYVNADATMTVSADGGSLTAKIGSNGTSSYTSGTTKISALAGWADVAENGDVAVTVYSTDAAGNVGDATRTFKKDTAVPTITSGSCSYTAPSDSKSTVTIVADGTGSAIAYYRFSGAVSGTTEFTSQPCEITLTGESPYSVTITVEDQAGNVSSGTTISITSTDGTFSIASPAGTTTARRSTTSVSSASSIATATTATTSSRSASRVTSTTAAAEPEAKSASWVTPTTSAGRARSEAASATTGAARADASTAPRAAVSSRSEAAEAKAPPAAATASDEPEATPPATEVKHSTTQPAGTAAGIGAAANAGSVPATAGASNAGAAPSTSGSSSTSGAPTAPGAPRAPDGTGDRMPTQAIMPESGRDGRRDEETEEDAR